MVPVDVETSLLTDGSKVTIRAITADDAPMLQAFVRRLSARSRRFRFFSALVELSVAQLERLVTVDHGRALALVAVSERSEQTAIVAEARCVPDLAVCNAEFAIAVADEFQRRGLGTQLMKRLFAYASRTGVRRLFGEILTDNKGMVSFVHRLGFRVRESGSDPSTLIASVLPPRRSLAFAKP